MVRSAIPGLWPALGMCFGNDIALNTPYPSAQVAADLAYLWQAGFRSLRMALPAHDDPVGTANIKAAALAAKAQGFTVSVGATGSGATITAANWSTYHSDLMAFAAWAAANAINEFQVGNELELTIDNTTLTAAQLRANIRQLAADVKAAGYTGLVSYSVPQGFSTNSAAWIAENNLGALDLLPINVYGDFDNDNNRGFSYYLNQMVNAFGARTYVSEFNVWYTWTTVVADMPIAGIVDQLRRRLADLRASGVQRAYFFTWSWRSNGDQFAVKLASGDLHPMIVPLLGTRAHFSGIPNVTTSRASHARTDVARTGV